MIADLVDVVLDETTWPLDRWAVAATLESRGIRDVDARERFGRRDVFDLADDVYAGCLERGLAEPPRAAAPTRRRTRARTIATAYLRGGYFFVQLALQLGSLVVLGYGQWASLDFSTRQASFVAVALLGSFTLSGAFAQMLGYLGPYFAAPGKHRLAARAVAVVVAAGCGSLLVAAAVAWLGNVVIGWYDERSIAAALAYFALAGLVSVANAVLYMLKQYLAMFAATVVGIVVVGLVLHHTSLGIYGAHWSGLGVTIALESAWGAAVLARRSRATEPELRAAITPPLGVVASAAAPYALYGIGYFVLLFVDRLAAWSAHSPGRLFTFNGPYEVGMDWALISVVPAIALLEVTIVLLPGRLGRLGREYGADVAAAHNRELLGFYRRQLALAGTALAAGALLAHLVARSAGGRTQLHSAFSDSTTLHVYAIALAGYAFLVWGLFNGLFLFSLGRPWVVLRCLAPAIAVAAVVSLALSREFVFWSAAGGLAAGTFVFALLGLRSTVRILSSVDYHYFAAY